MTKLLLLLTFISFSCFGQSESVEGEPDAEEYKKQALSTFENLIRPHYSKLEVYNKLKLKIKRTPDDTTIIFNATVELPKTKPSYRNTEKYQARICDTLLRLGKKCYKTINQFNDIVLVDLAFLSEADILIAGDTLKAKKIYSDGGITKVDYIFNSNGLPVRRITYYGGKEEPIKLSSKTTYLYTENRITARIDTTFEQVFVNPLRINYISETYFTKDQQPEKRIRKQYSYFYGNQSIVISTSDYKYNSEGKLVYFDDKTNNTGHSWIVDYKNNTVIVKTYFNEYKSYEYRYELIK